MQRRVLFLASATLIATVGLPVGAASAANLMTDLGTLTGSGNSSAAGLNAFGRVVGTSSNGTAGRAVVWTPPATAGGPYTIADLGTLGGPSSAATGINDSGTIVGSARLASDHATHATVWSSSTHTATDLATLCSDSSFCNSAANAINGSGRIVGVSARSGGNDHATLWVPGPSGYSVTDLGTLGGSLSGALAINKSGQIVGYSYTAGDASEDAAVWTPPAVAGGAYTVQDLGNLINPGGSVATGINSAGRITGRANATRTSFAGVLWTPPKTAGGKYTLVNLGTLGKATPTASDGYAINKSGRIVGDSTVPGGAADDAVLWTPPKTVGGHYAIHDRGTLGGNLAVAYAISDSGRIVGYSYMTGNASSHAFIL